MPRCWNPLSRWRLPTSFFIYDRPDRAGRRPDSRLRGQTPGASRGPYGGDRSGRQRRPSNGRELEGSRGRGVRGSWHQRHRPGLLRIHEALTGLAQSAENNAHEQDRASLASGSAARSAPPAALWRDRGDAATNARLESEIVAATQGKSESDVLQWWNQLPGSKQLEYIRTVPAFLASMPALSLDMQALAGTNRAEAGESGQSTAFVDYGAGSVKGGMRQGISMSAHLNGVTDVTIMGGASVGATRKLGVAGGSGQVDGEIERGRGCDLQLLFGAI